MMRLTRRASLLVAFSLLAPAATAYAECAWVLWTKQALVSGGAQPPELEAAYKSREDCVGVLNQKESREDCVGVLNQKDPGRRMTATMLILGDKAWMCLPDTVDPRGPKGK